MMSFTRYFFLLIMALIFGCTPSLKPMNPAVHTGSTIPHKVSSCINLRIIASKNLDQYSFYAHGLKTIKVDLKKPKAFYLAQSLKRAINEQFFASDDDIVCNKGEYVLEAYIHKFDLEKTSGSWWLGEEKMNAILNVKLIEKENESIIFEKLFDKSMIHTPSSSTPSIEFIPKKVSVFMNKFLSTVTSDIASHVRAEFLEIAARKKRDRREPEKTISRPSAPPEVRQKRPFMGQQWAVIVGVSQYQDSRIPGLRYAEKDARAFYDWIVSPQGGRYAPSKVKLLVNETATAAGIKDALFVWLRQALEEDVVTVYFACHGSPDSPDSPENLFMLPFDVKYDKIAITGFPMWDVETALERYIKARKVIVIADACHSGGVGQEFDISRRANRGIVVNPISSGLQNLSNVGEGICVFSASDSSQFSQESEKWGGGHGVFTYFLLSALKGDADYNKDGNVSLGELIPYVSEHVRRETRNAQSPIVTGKFDPALSIGR